ncbi:hypothetical protein [Mycolicibacterium fortuitum]|uniref:hypothetical protein n=1 Tax=Mycolicibacterium fortuitum TaxID=1766 RepID=UPI001CE0A305|nr:hypothetical protein [Mycolicibacterium fortuitum]
MFSQGVSNRVHPLRRDRVFHMLVRDDSASTRWRTWCGYGLAREDAPGPYLGVTKSTLCGKCKQLAADAVAEETIDETESAPFAYKPETADPAADDDDLADDDEDFYPDNALPAHHLDDDGGGQRGECPHSGQARNSNGGCPRGCDGARHHYTNDGHRGCSEKVPG